MLKIIIKKMEDKKEITSSEYPNLVSYDCSKKILEQMEKKYMQN